MLLILHQKFTMSSSSDLPNSFFFFFNDTATTEIYTLSLHDALPIWEQSQRHRVFYPGQAQEIQARQARGRSEEHTSELQSRLHLVCRLLLEKKKNTRHR